MAEKNVAVNRRASHDYEILERVEAGIALTGSEIKSIREGRVSLQEAYARPERGELWLHGAHIAQYGPAFVMECLDVLDDLEADELPTFTNRGGWVTVFIRDRWESLHGR